ncbi:MAG: ABC transporter permease [Oscillospiraceae bacterium]|jgi:ribose transport system permease protein|nr:ABC transporter permease [Oscillospiraceae bacterium]
MAETRKSGLKFKRLFSEYSYAASFVLLLILAAVVSGMKGTAFFRWTNISNIFTQTSTTGIIALGMMMVICAGMIDISVGAQVAIISGFGIKMLNIFAAANLAPWLSVAAMLVFCLLFGLLIGTFNGLLVSKGRMPAMIATLATQNICRSIINHFGQGGPITISTKTEAGNGAYNALRSVSVGYVPLGNIRVPIPMIMFIAAVALFCVIMQRTKLGKHIYAVGSNENAARLAGVGTTFIKTAVFSITGLLCGFAAWLYASRVMAVAVASAGSLYEMDAIAAVAIGGTAMSGGRGKVLGTFLGVLMFKIIDNVLLMANVPTFLTRAISGAIIIIAVLLQNVYGSGAQVSARRRVNAVSVGRT